MQRLHFAIKSFGFLALFAAVAQAQVGATVPKLAEPPCSRETLAAAAGEELRFDGKITYEGPSERSSEGVGAEAYFDWGRMKRLAFVAYGVEGRTRVVLDLLGLRSYRLLVESSWYSSPLNRRNETPSQRTVVAYVCDGTRVALDGDPSLLEESRDWLGDSIAHVLRDLLPSTRGLSVDVDALR